MLMFILLAYFVSEIFALKYALIIVGSLQLISLPLAKNIVNASESVANDNSIAEVKIQPEEYRVLDIEKAI